LSKFSFSHRVFRIRRNRIGGGVKNDYLPVFCRFFLHLLCRSFVFACHRVVFVVGLALL